jgi:hypothetical protein
VSVVSIVVASCLVIESVQAIKRLSEVGPSQFEVGMDGYSKVDQGGLGVTGFAMSVWGQESRV